MTMNGGFERGMQQTALTAHSSKWQANDAAEDNLKEMGSEEANIARRGQAMGCATTCHFERGAKASARVTIMEIAFPPNGRLTA